MENIADKPAVAVNNLDAGALKREIRDIIALLGA
jgi:hypothetical protein